MVRLLAVVIRRCVYEKSIFIPYLFIFLIVSGCSNIIPDLAYAHINRETGDWDYDHRAGYKDKQYSFGESYYNATQFEHIYLAAMSKEAGYPLEEVKLGVAISQYFQDLLHFHSPNNPEHAYKLKLIELGYYSQ